MTSEAGWASTPGFGPYNVTKAALNSLGASMAAEYSARFPETDLQLNVLVPGEAKTEMNHESKESPYSVVSMALMLLTHPKNGPKGRFFHRDGRHLSFAYTEAYDRRLI
jgi:NAD(P)-dependent dehydrogenase (short-subunit alcohol dehydrogenase family)